MTIREVMSRVLMFAITAALSAAGDTVRADERAIRILPPMEGERVDVAPDTLWALASIHDRIRLVSLNDAAGQELTLLLDRFQVTTPETRLVRGRIGSPDETHPYDSNRVVLLRGHVEGSPHDRAFLAVTTASIQGFIQRGGRSFSVGNASAYDGDKPSTSRLVITSSQSGFVPPVPVCGLHVDAPILSGRGEPDETAPRVGLRALEMAVDTDYEYYELFNDLDAAGDYVVQLYGALSDVYMRDVDTRVVLTYVRLWDTPTDPYDASDPLGPFQNEWEQNQDDVQRDVAQLLTGRRDLPYGGVAMLNGLCNSSAYSVAGFINGSFTSTSFADPGNWDLIVTAHELGHNCGTLHTHDGYSPVIDGCGLGVTERGTIMSYCHVEPGGIANVDMHMHARVETVMRGFMNGAGCLIDDCNANGVADEDDLSSGASLDLNASGIPDECEDCNGNGVLDSVDIAGGLADVNSDDIPDVCQPDCNANAIPDRADVISGNSADADGNNIPDECEPDCDGDGVFDWAEINDDMNLDIDRTVVLDACQDCDGDGITDAEALNGAHHLWVASAGSDSLGQYHARSGVLTFNSDDGFLSSAQDLLIDGQQRMLVASALDNRVAWFDVFSGVYLGDFVTAGSGGLSYPAGLIYAATGNLLVSSRNSDSVLEYDATSGAFVSEFVPAASGGLARPYGLVFGPGGNLFVASGNSHEVKEYDGFSGEFVANFVSAGSGGLAGPRGLVFSQGNLLVASFNSDAILEYDGTTGAFIRQFNESGQDSGYWELARPRTLRIGPNGQVYAASSQGDAGIHMYDKFTGKFLRMFYVLAQDGLSNTSGFDFVPGFDVDCHVSFLPDLCDIASGASPDANANDIPDECESIGVCEGDANGDGTVDPLDAGYVQARFGCPVGTGDVECDAADTNGDSAVDPLDVGFVLARFGVCAE